VTIAKSCGLITILLVCGGTATAAPIFNILYDPAAGFSAADQTTIQNAVNFYAANMTGNFTVTIAFGSQAGGGGSSQWSTETAAYSDYYNALLANSSGDATDTTAIASLGAPSVNNPVTGSPNIVLTTTLASLLGLGVQSSSPFASCGGLTADACITLSQGALNVSGTPLAGLGGIVQHEVDEVLGTASNLPNGGGSVPADPLAADLFRYGSPNVRSFAINTSTGVPCTGSPTAYFSIDGGATNLNSYNNCNNGGDYGDWIGTDGLQVQDAFGPDTQAASLSLSSPETTLLDAIGYNFTTSVSAVPEPASIGLVLAGLLLLPLVRKRR
jgi:hypothetical protein